MLDREVDSNRASSGIFLDFDSQNRPHVGYVDTVNQQLKHAVWTGSMWQTRVIDSDPVFRFASSNFSATLDDADQMHVAWVDDGDVLRYARPNGISWSISAPLGSLDTSVRDIDVDSQGHIHLANDVFTGSVFTGGLHYAHYDGNIWTNERVEGRDGFGSGRSKLIADAQGNAHLFSYDSTFSGPTQLKHFVKDNGQWTNEIIDSFTDSSSGPDNIEVTLSEQGYHVVFSTGNREIYYAFQEIANTTSADYDANGSLDGMDFLALQREFPSLITDWNAKYGTNAPATASTTTIPEPTSCLLYLLCCCLLPRRNQR